MVQKLLGAHKNSTIIYKCVFVESDMIKYTSLFVCFFTSLFLILLV